jgi:hypothetical protein
MKTNRQRKTILLKVSFPLWFRVLYAVGGPLVTLSICVALFNLAQNDFTLLAILRGGFLILIVSLGVWAVPIFFSTIYAKESGIHRRGLWGARQTFTWNEIKTVARPRFGIPGDAAYIVSKNEEKMTFARSMSGYAELLRLIQEKAPNVRANGLSESLWPSKSVNAWRNILIFLALFIAYIIVRKLTGW